MDGADPLDQLGLELGVVHTAGHDDHVGRGHVDERLLCHETGAAGVVGNRPGLGRHEDDVVAGHVGEHLEGPDDVEHREVRIEGQCDLHRSSLVGR